MGLANDDGPVETRYSWKIGFIYVFNLIVGAGALTLPKAFAESGWVLGTIALGVLALMSYCTSTFMIEAMAIANGVLRLKARGNIQSKYIGNGEASKTEETDEDISEIEPILGGNENLYEITKKVEMGDMAKLFFNKAGLLLYYVVISSYLYGDLAIYAAAVPKSMTTTVCGDTTIFDHDVNQACKTVKSVSVIQMYKLMLGVFVVTLCPFVFFNIGKTKFLQIFTTLFRWISFLVMVILAFIKILKHEKSHPNTSHWFNFQRLPGFFGVAVYSFMCQHSLPSILTPVKNKKRLNLLILLDFASTASFYALMALTAVFAFPSDALEDLYTLNFPHPIVLKYFLELFPVFTLSTNFPIIAITLRENLKTLFLRKERNHGIFVKRLLFPLIAIAPPVAIAYFTHNVGMLVNITGTYAGAIIQYIIPVMLVYFGRKNIRTRLGYYINDFRSPFRHRFWIFFVVVWYLMCFVFVTVYMFNHKVP